MPKFHLKFTKFHTIVTFFFKHFTAIEPKIQAILTNSLCFTFVLLFKIHKVYIFIGFILSKLINKKFIKICLKIAKFITFFY